MILSGYSSPEIRPKGVPLAWRVLPERDSPVDGTAFTGADVRAATVAHVLDQAMITGIYDIYPDARVDR